MSSAALRQYQLGGDPHDLLGIREQWSAAYPGAEIRVLETIEYEYGQPPKGLCGVFVRLRLDGYCTHARHREGEIPKIPARCSLGVPHWHRVEHCLWPFPDDAISKMTWVETT